MKTHCRLVTIMAAATVLLTAAVELTLAAADPAVQTILAYQRDCGGWPKNYDRRALLRDAQLEAIRKDHAKNDAMIDNGATHTEIRALATAYQTEQDERYRTAALRGIRYLLDGQYPNGGWPQRFPDPTNYSRYITFNDNAMIGVMTLLSDASRDQALYSFVSPELRAQCQWAVERGIQCILKCQIRVNGQLTVWCAQHDHVTFAPQKARSYELASLSGSESVGIVKFLMRIDRPSPEVVQSIEAAVAWFERSKIEGIKVVRQPAPGTPKGYDQVVVHDKDAPPMWARFYDIESNKPIFCSRDGVPRESLADISYERRNGYSWLGNYGQSLLEKDWKKWKERLGGQR